MNVRAIHICSFSSTDDLRGKALNYENVKRIVLAAGRFSIFEATRNPKRIAIFSDLNRDPELDVTTLAYPWFGVKRRDGGAPA